MASERELEQIVDEMSKSETMSGYYKLEAEANEQIHDALERFRELYNSGEITDDMLKSVSEIKSIDYDSLIKYCNMSRLEMEETACYKSDLSGEFTHIPRMRNNTTFPDDYINDPEYADYDFSNMDLKITRKGNTYHCESEYLGTFDFTNTHYNDDGKPNTNWNSWNILQGGTNTNEWSVGFKVIEEDDGSKSYLPVLEYAGTDDCVADINTWFGESHTQYPPTIPNGVKSLDYTFAGHTNLNVAPRSIPDSVRTMHCTFENCNSMVAANPVVFTGNGDVQVDGTKKYLYLPSDIEDLSCAFKNCEIFQCDVKSIDKDGTKHDGLPRELMCAVESFSGCEKLDDKIEYNYTQKIFGINVHQEGVVSNVDKPVWSDYPLIGKDYTPYLSAVTARGVLDSIADTNDKRKDAGDGIDNYRNGLDYNVNDDGSVDNSEGLDEGKLDAAKAAAVQVRHTEVYDGKVITNQELMGQTSTDHKIQLFDENGNPYYIDDATGKKTSTNNLYKRPENLLDHVGLYAMAAAATSLVTRNRIAGLAVGVGGFILSNCVDGLPKSMYPIIKFTANILPDGFVKDKLVEWSHTLPGYIDELNADIKKNNAAIMEANKFWDDQYNVGDTWKEARNTKIFKDGFANINDGWSVDKFMSENAKECSKQMTFIATAMAETDTNSAGYYVKNVIDPCLDSMENHWKSSINGNITDAQKVSMREYYLSIVSALESYNRGAQLGDEMYYADDDLKKDLSQAGRDIVNRNYMSSVMESIQQMDSQYHFMNEETWEKISSFDISGVDIGNIKNYDSKYMQNIAVQEMPKLSYMQHCYAVEHDGTDEEKADSDNVYSHSHMVAIGNGNVKTIYDFGYDPHKYDNAVGMPDSARRAALEGEKACAQRQLDEYNKSLREKSGTSSVDTSEKSGTSSVDTSNDTNNKSDKSDKSGGFDEPDLSSSEQSGPDLEVG